MPARSARSRLVRHAAAAAWLLTLALWPAAVRADEAEELFNAGLDAERSLDFSRAVAAYERSLLLRPSASFAHRARIRLDDLRAHAEGDFGPLAKLERVRRSASLASDPAALAALLDQARAFPPGRVQAEALLLLTEAYGRRLHDPERTLAPAALLAQGPFDRPLRARGLEALVEAYEALGRRAEARAALAALPGLAPTLERRMRVDDRRVLLRRGSLGALGLLGLLAAAAAVRLRSAGLAALGRLALAPASWAVAAVISLGGAALTWLFDSSLSLRPFLLLGPGVLAVDRAVALGRRAFGSALAVRLVAALVGVAAVAAVALLSLLHSDPAFLESFGL